MKSQQRAACEPERAIRFDLIRSENQEGLLGIGDDSKTHTPYTYEVQPSLPLTSHVSGFFLSSPIPLYSSFYYYSPF